MATNAPHKSTHKRERKDKIPRTIEELEEDNAAMHEQLTSVDIWSERIFWAVVANGMILFALFIMVVSYLLSK